MKEIIKSDYPDVFFGENVKIKCVSAKIQAGVKIGNNVSIECENIEIGYDSIIENGTIIKAIGGKVMQDFVLGDNCLIGFNSQILVPNFLMNDYSQIHNSALCSGYKPFKMGYNCWVGQGAILNSFENLTIGNNVRMGGCQIWTHVASGELMEGSNFYGSNSVTIEDNVWLMGFGQLITPGVTLKRGSVVMAGSIITKSTEPNKTYSGIPAKDVSDKLPAWKEISLTEKLEMSKKFANEFINQFPEYNTSIHVLSSKDLTYQHDLEQILKLKNPQVIIVDIINVKEFEESIHSIYDLETKRYLKKRSSLEINYMKFNLGYRARFIPI